MFVLPLCNYQCRRTMSTGIAHHSTISIMRMCGLIAFCIFDSTRYGRPAFSRTQEMPLACFIYLASHKYLSRRSAQSTWFIMTLGVISSPHLACNHDRKHDQNEKII